MNIEKEATTVGLTQDAKRFLDRFKENGVFNDLLDAYRFGIAYAIAKKGIVESSEGMKFNTVFNVGSLDGDHQIYNTVKLLYEPEPGTVYKTIERLAEWGIRELNEAYQGSIDFNKVF